MQDQGLMINVWKLLLCIKFNVWINSIILAAPQDAFGIIVSPI